MAQIMHIEGATRVIGKSQGYFGLPVRDGFIRVLDERTECMTTSWELTPDELEALLAGGILVVQLIGNFPHVVVAVLNANQVITRTDICVEGRTIDKTTDREVPCRLWGFSMSEKECVDHANGSPLHINILGTEHPPILVFVQGPD